MNVAGKGGRRTLLDIIRSQFELIHATIPQLAVEEKIPLPDNPDVVADYRNLVTMLELGETSFVPVGSKRRYDVRPLLDGIETEQRRETKKEDADNMPRRPARPTSPSSAGPVVWWQIGFFLVFAFVIIVGAFAGVAWLAGGGSLSVVVIGTVLVLCLVGGVTAWFTGRLTERNALTLIKAILNRLGAVRAPKAG